MDNIKIEIVAVTAFELRSKVLDLAHAFGVNAAEGPVVNENTTPRYPDVGVESAPEKIDTRDESAEADLSNSVTESLGPKRRGRKPGPKAKAENKSVTETDTETLDTGAENTVSEIPWTTPPQGEPAKVETPKMSLDDARSALEKLADKLGISAGRDLLGRYGAKKLSELSPEKYDAFIRACEEKLVGA